jgi:hypothetical protein
MAKAYITFDAPTVVDGQIYAGASIQTTTVENFNSFAIGMGFAGEPSAETITATVVAVLVAIGNVSYPDSFDADDVVLFNAPT